MMVIALGQVQSSVFSSFSKKGAPVKGFLSSLLSKASYRNTFSTRVTITELINSLNIKESLTTFSSL